MIRSLKEGVKGFNASLIHAYGEYTKFPSMELPMSDIEFFDMLLNLTEFKENDTYNPDQIGILHDDLSTCFSFLQPYTMRHDKPEEVKQLWTQIMKLGRKVDNMIDTFEEFPTWYNKLRVSYVSEEVKLIKENLPKISSTETSKTKVEGSGAHAENQMEKGHATEHSNDEVSFEEEDRLRTQLTTGSRSLEKISIVGMPGLGKTTLAMRLYKDCAKSFTAHAWCYVGQEFQRKELLQHIISQISERPSSETNVMTVEDLAKLLKQCLLQKKNYLIVLDDVWDVDAWDALCKSFPPSHNGSRILITSRYNIVGKKVCGDKNVINVIKLNLLTADKSWHLLQKKVFGARSYPKRLHEVGKGIAEKCGGLPLSIVMIAGVLKYKNETEDSWKEIERSLDDHLLNAGSSTVELSYRHLSVRMKQCFLYCATFSKGAEIPRSKLIRLWLAERFVETSCDQESLESAAEKYLCDLVDRSLLIVVKRGSNHRIQTCRIHDLLLDFCIQKGKAEKFLFAMNRCDEPASCQQHGRVCFRETYNPSVTYILKGLTLVKPRTLICSSGLYGPFKKFEFVFKDFKSLTLLDLEKHEVGLYGISASVGELTLLRYLSLRGYIKTIPSSISRLLNLETLIVRGTRGEVDVPHTIFSLNKLRDLVVDKRASIGVHQMITFQWITTATFKNLKYLRMEGLNIKEWEASDDNFPSLERLVVRRCKSLHKIPEEFGNKGDLMGIEAHWCDTSLVKSVLKIKRKQIDGGNMKFEAIIYPTVLDLSDDEELSE